MYCVFKYLSHHLYVYVTLFNLDLDVFIIGQMDDFDDDEYSEQRKIWSERQEEWLMFCGVAIEGIAYGYEMCISRTPCRTSCRTGNIFILEILNGHPARCYQDFRLHVDVFRSLCDDLANYYGLEATRNMSIEESVGIFLMTIAHGCGNRLVQETFNHSGETIHRHFHKVLRAVLRLSNDIIKPSASYNDEVSLHILNNKRYYPFFKVLY